MIHLSIGAIQRDTKTACKVKLEELPRADGSVLFKNRHLVTCAECAKKAESIAKLTNH